MSSFRGFFGGWFGKKGSDPPSPPPGPGAQGTVPWPRPEEARAWCDEGRRGAGLDLPMVAGAWLQFTGYNFQGSIDEFQGFSRSVTAHEVQALYEQGR